MRDLLYLYTPGYIRVLVYMLQSTEYQVGPYLKWFLRTSRFSTVQHRRALQKTRVARMLLYAGYLWVLLQIAVGVSLMYGALTGGDVFPGLYGAVILGSYPVTVALVLTVPLLAGRLLIIRPKERKLVHQSRSRFAQHKAVKIAVAGSYGKTSMKEILGTVLSAGRKVAITPANMNVTVSHAKFAKKLDGDEDILVIEYGEGKPGDIARFIRYTSPDIGVITGLAPAHLDHYKTLEAAGKDIWGLAEYLHGKPMYVNGESAALKDFIQGDVAIYTHEGVRDWKVSQVRVNVDSLAFSLKKKNQTIQVHSGLVGRHQIGPLAAAAVLALDLGLTKSEIEKGLAQTQPFEHRMQPRQLYGAWIIDDTYNGNIEGAEAGLALLKELKADRKIYVTPGLVDQGTLAESVHERLGKAIAKSKPDKVVLMKNSVTKWIQRGLKAADYQGEVHLESDPLTFYSNLDQIVARGDVVLMQNDWTDNYN